MERMVPPNILANFTFGGAVLVQGKTGMLFSPMGMCTQQKAIQALCCPGCLQVAFSYTDGAYSKGVQVDSRPAGCCGKPHWTISKKDYTTPAEGKDDAKLYPKKEVLASTVKHKKSNRGKPWGIKLPDAVAPSIFSGPPLHFSVKNKMICCAGCTQCPGYKNCNDGILKGFFCMNFKNPIYDLEGNKVAYVVQTVPIFPTSCCCADTGPTVQMAIHQHPEYKGKLSEDDIARLSLFMFTVTPNIPGTPGGGHGGPLNIIGKFSNMLLAKTGWALGFGMTEVETEYLSMKQVFNGEISGIGVSLEAIRNSA